MLGNPVGEAERLEDFRRCFVHRQRLMTSITVLSDCFSAAARVRAVMAPEASRKIRVTQVVRIGAPRDFQVRKDVAIVNRKNRLTSLIDVLSALCVNVGVFLLVKVGERCRQFRVRLFICRVACLQEFDTFLLYVRQTHRDVSCGESLVHCSLRQIESMCRTVMTIDALHLVGWERLH